MANLADITSRDDSAHQNAEAHLSAHLLSLWQRVDRLLAGLLVFEWVGCCVLAVWRTPLNWIGSSSTLHPHFFAAVFLGGVITLLPVGLVLKCPGRAMTRHVVAAAQMLMSALLIHLGDGRIEMHFHIFGSLAFLAFYRDWRVLITATAVVTLDHLLRGIFMPVSVYGVLTASLWRTAEHAGWVIFEDLFLIGSCVQGVKELRGIANQRALLEHSHRNVEQKVTLRTNELQTAQTELVKSARFAGMAEIATSVLHNVGNVLNSVNVSATIVADKLRQSEVPSLARVSGMILSHQADLGTYLTSDPRGKMIPDFLTQLATCLSEEQREMLSEVEQLATGIEHIKQVVAAQQTMVKTSNVRSDVNPADLLDTALSIQGRSTVKSIRFERDYQFKEAVNLDQHKVLQILINLVSNARHAVMSQPESNRLITLRVLSVDGKLRYQVCDSGVGIKAENLTRIFSHGFTTKKEGHGFGLHSSVNAAREMGGSLTVTSEGENRGAQFTLDIPLKFVSEATPCKI